MIKTLKQYLSLRGLLTRRLRERRKEIQKIGKLPSQCSELEKSLAYANGNNNIKSLTVFYFCYEGGRKDYEQKVEFQNMGSSKFRNLQNLIELNLVSEQLKQLKVYD